MVYAFKNTSINNSSSGAAFPTIVSVLFGINEAEVKFTNLIVYGAAFNEDFTISHQRAESIEECEKFRGSKYVQSNLGNSFKQIREDLQSGKKVLFSGTPCQVNALKLYLKETDRTNLYLIDIICHGVPITQVWLDYINWLEKRYGSRLKEFSFRYQKAKWKQYPIMAKFQNGTRVINSYELRIYIKLFFSNMIMRESCYDCKFANLNRPGDLTIGDFWGIESVMPEFPYKDSVSQILVNTVKGQEIMNYIHIIEKNTSNILIRKCDSSDYLKYQYNLNHSTQKPKNTNQFWEDYKEYDFEYIIKKYVGYSWRGKIKHCIVRILHESGLMKIIKRVNYIIKTVNVP